MNKSKSPNSKRGLWSEEDMRSALTAIRRGHCSQRDAAIRYNIPRRTLRDHIKSGSSVKKMGRNSILNKQQEQDLVRRIIRLAEIGVPLTMKMLRHNVYRFCQKNNIKNNFNKQKEMAGRDWMRTFLNRNPKISKRKAQFMNQARAQKLNKFIVDDHFQKLGQLLDDLDLKQNPAKIFNMDEKGCRLTLHHQPAVLAKKGAKRVHFIANEHAESVTVVGCVSAIGNAIPPMIIFKGKRLKPEFTDNLPPGSTVRMAPKGFMTKELFVDFIKHLAKFKPPGKVLLVFDGASCHFDLGIVETADENDIALYCLPSNTTHELQPLDKSVYRSFEHHWDVELLQYQAENPERKINKSSFNTILTRVWSKCMTHTNIVNGFRAVGLYPFNPEAIPETAFAPASITAKPQINTHDDLTNISVDDDSWDSEDDLPLSQLKLKLTEKLDTSFQELLPTPITKQSTATKPRKKAINYKAQQVTKDLFTKEDDQNLPSTSLKNDNAYSKKDDWYCSACNDCRMVDMRQCQQCTIWFHEECLGLTDMDAEFECPNCTD